MSATQVVTFRLPKKYHPLAEDFLEKSGEQNFNTLAQKLLISELEKSLSENQNSVRRFDDENVQFLLAAFGNLREVFLRVFEMVFASAEGKKQFENTVEELQNDWSAINQMFERRNSAGDSASLAIFEDGIASEIENIFEINMIDLPPQNFAFENSVNSKSEHSKTLKQKTLFD